VDDHESSAYADPAEVVRLYLAEVEAHRAQWDEIHKRWSVTGERVSCPRLRVHPRQVRAEEEVLGQEGRRPVVDRAVRTWGTPRQLGRGDWGGRPSAAD
jgi:hypothetical protein